MSDIFVSHAVADRHLAELLVDLMVDAIGVPARRIFCSSLPGFGTPLSHDFNDHMRRQIGEAKLVVLLMTPAYMDSAFCMMEVGATWALDLRPLPIVVPPVSFDEVTRTLGLRQGWTITDGRMVQGVRETLLEAAGIDGHDNHTFDRKRDRWTNDLPRALERLAPAPKVAASLFDEVLAENRSLEDRLAELRRESGRLSQELSASRQLRPVALVIESEPLIAQDLSLILEGQGFVVGGVARSEGEAVEMAARLRPDIVTAEVALADGSSGIAAVNKIVSMSETLPIFVTAFPERLLTIERPEHSHLVTKPFDVETIVEALSSSYGRVRSYRAKKSTDRARP